jgi:general secretion pathway protein J
MSGTFGHPHRPSNGWPVFGMAVRPLRAHSGLTLVELLVSIAILSVLTALAWRALDGLSRTEQVTRQRTDDLLALQAGLGQWAADLDALVETGELPALDFDGRVLRMTRRDPTEGTVLSPGVTVVAWAVQGGQWMRWQLPGLRQRAALQRAWSDAARWGQRPLDADRSREVAVLPASGWQVFYYRGDAWTNPLSSQGVNDNPDMGVPGGAALAALRQLTAPPDGVRLVLTLGSGQVLSGNLTRDWARPVLGGGKS